MNYQLDTKSVSGAKAAITFVKAEHITNRLIPIIDDFMGATGAAPLDDLKDDLHREIVLCLDELN